MAQMYEVIEQLLKERGISGAKMSTELGMSRSFMTELRKGRAKGVTVETAQKIADYFNVSVDRLLDRSVGAATEVTVNYNHPTAKKLYLTPINRNQRAQLRYLRAAAPRKPVFSAQPTHKQNFVQICTGDGTVENRELSDDQVAAVRAVLKQMPEIAKK